MFGLFFITTIERAARVREAILTVAATDAADSILMVSHGAAIWGLVKVLDIAFPPGVFLPNCALLTFIYENGNYDLQSIVVPVNKETLYQKEG